MNEDINLCEILKGCEGIKLYSTIQGSVTLIELYKNSNYPILLESEDGFAEAYSKEGKYRTDKGECVVFPSKEQRDWSKFEIPIPINAPMMVSYNKINWILRYYSGKYEGFHQTYNNGYKKEDKMFSSNWHYMIPFDKFNPDNIEESLKYNIQK